jgi:hypothetical protein
VFGPRVLSIVMTLNGHYGVERGAVVNEQYSHIGVPFVQMGKSSVECTDDSLQCGVSHLWICWGGMRIGGGPGCLG